MRREFPKKVKQQRWEHCNGKCEGSCGRVLRTGHIHYDHDIPDAMGGEPTFENCRVLCTECHGAKTGQRDIPTIAKSNRVRDRHLGIRKRSSFQTSRDGPFRKKLSGEVVRR